MIRRTYTTTPQVHVLQVRTAMIYLAFDAVRVQNAFKLRLLHPRFFRRWSLLHAIVLSLFFPAAVAHAVATMILFLLTGVVVGMLGWSASPMKNTCYATGKKATCCKEWSESEQGKQQSHGECRIDQEEGRLYPATRRAWRSGLIWRRNLVWPRFFNCYVEMEQWLLSSNLLEALISSETFFLCLFVCRVGGSLVAGRCVDVVMLCLFDLSFFYNSNHITNNRQWVQHSLTVW